MKFELSTVAAVLSALAFVPSAFAKSPIEQIRRSSELRRSHEHFTSPLLHKRASSKDRGKFYNNATAKFWVDGTKIPDVNFDVGESYSGLMPISKKANETGELFFWFYPTTSNQTEDLVVWLNGGPGCSSLEGILQENGPFLWQYGTFLPVPNEYSWHKLTNMVWIEQPIGTGFTQGTVTARNEEDVSAQLLGFLENFIETFGLQRKNLYITGESYAGQYVPYIVDALHNTNNTDLFNIKGLMIYDPSLTYDVVQESMQVMPFVDHHQDLFVLNESFTAEMQARHESCGYAKFMEENLVFPPTGILPTPPQVDTSNECDIWDTVLDAAFFINPCFDIYQIATTCPNLWDVLGFPGSFDFLPAGATIYFNRTDVQDAIHAPHMEWTECSNGNVFVRGDASPATALSVLPSVIERNERTIIGHALLDYILIMNGTLIAIQNMTWNGAQGFSEAPSKPFEVPYDDQGVMGVTRTERNLTFVTVELSGHMIPQYQPQSAFRMLEYLLGRIPEL